MAAQADTLIISVSLRDLLEILAESMDTYAEPSAITKWIANSIMIIIITLIKTIINLIMINLMIIMISKGIVMALLIT